MFGQSVDALRGIQAKIPPTYTLRVSLPAGY